MKTGAYRGIKYRVQKFQGATIYEGYDGGYRVVYALSRVEFERKVDAYLATGATNQATPVNRKCKSCGSRKHATCTRRGGAR